MAWRRRRVTSRLESEINVTPMGDVSLSLLLGFLVITPIIIETMPTTLPQGGGVASGQVKQDPVL
ncbi:MAG TPA: protein TolR, partial [Candidatus Handelsmanbacteria bacterium]|nr:protein TolR [Candidatus Handelsmanbacteria bacterium]